MRNAGLFGFYLPQLSLDMIQSITLGKNDGKWPSHLISSEELNYQNYSSHSKVMKMVQKQ